MELRDLPEQLKQELRRTKKLPLAIKSIVYGGNLAGVSMSSQFNYDLFTYNLYEALLYVEGYEKKKQYKEGTTQQLIATLQTTWKDESDELQEA